MKRPFLTLLLCIAATASFAQQLSNRIPYFKDGKYGVCDTTKKIIIQPLYDDVKMSDSLGFIALKQGTLWGIWDQNGNMIIAPAYETIDINDHYTHFDVTNKGKYGAVSFDGKVVIPCKFDYVGSESSQYVFVQKKKKYGTYSLKTGKLIFPVKSLDYPAALTNTIFETKKNGYAGMMNSDGVQIVPNKYEYTQGQGAFIMASMKGGANYDLYDTLGHLLLAKQTYMSIGCTKDSLVSIELGDGYAVYTTSGRKIFPRPDSSTVDGYALCNYDTIPYVITSKTTEPVNSDESDYYYYDSYTTTYGIADWKGNVILPPVYNEIEEIYFGPHRYYRLRTDSSYIIKDDKLHDFLVIDDDSAYSVSEYHEHLMIVQYNEMFGAMDYNQHMIIPIKYNSLHYDDKYDRFYYQKHLGYGVMDGKGKPLTRPIYSSIEDYTDSVAIVHDIYGEFSNLVDLKGKLLLKDSSCEALEAVYPFGDGYYDGEYGEGYYGDDYYGDGYYGEDYTDTTAPKHLKYYTFSRNEKYGVICSNGKIIIPDTCYSVYAFGHDGIFEISNKDQTSFAICDSTGKHVSKMYGYMADAGKLGLIEVSIKPYVGENEYVDPNTGDYITVASTDTLKYGYVDSKGKEIVPPVYTSELTSYQYDDYGYSIPSTDSFLFMQRRDTLIDVYDVAHGLLKGLSGKYTNIESYDHKHPLFIVHSSAGDKIGLMDANGKEILPMNFLYIYPFETDSNFVVAEDSAYTYHYFDMQGHPAKFDVDYPGAIFSPSYPGEMMVSYKDKYGVITTDGRVLVPVEYEDVVGLREGYYGVKKGGKFGVVTNHNKQILAPEFAGIEGFFRGNILMVYLTESDRSSEKGRLIDLNGTRFWD